MQTPLFAVQKSARQLLVYHTSILPADAVVLRGQTNNHALNLTFMNPGATGTARVDITRLILAVTDATGASLSPAAAFSRVSVGGGQLYGETTDMPSSGNLITLMLGNSYCPVPVYQPVTISVLVDIKPDAQATAFRISLPNAVAVRAQDANSLLAVPVSNTCVPYASLPDPFPMSSPLVRVASSFQVSGLSLAPKNIYPNQRTDLLQLVLTHPGPAELGTLLLNGLTLTAQEAGGSPLDPAQDLTALWVTDTNAGLLSQVRAPELGEQTFIPLPSLPIAPFSSITIRIGLEAGATFSHATLRLGLLDGLSILASQPLDPTRPVVSIGSWPLMSAAASLGGGEGRLRVSNYPNPFSPGRQPTRIAYYLEQPGLATAVLYTLLGDEVKLFFLEENQAIGEHTLIWDGRTSGGAAVVNGIYLLRLQVKFHGSGETVTQIRKIAVVK